MALTFLTMYHLKKVHPPFQKNRQECFHWPMPTYTAYLVQVSACFWHSRHMEARYLQHIDMITALSCAGNLPEEVKVTVRNSNLCLATISLNEKNKGLSYCRVRSYPQWRRLSPIRKMLHRVLLKQLQNRTRKIPKMAAGMQNAKGERSSVPH